MKVAQIIDKLEQLAPIAYAESWDNVGLLVGSREREVKKIMVALDATDAVIEQAIAKKVDMIITHHPMIFSAMKRVTDEDFIGRRILRLVKHDISYYAMHTNCDVCVMNDVAAEKIHLISEDILELVSDREGTSMGIGKVGTLQEEVTVKQLAEQTKEAFDLGEVRVTGDVEKEVKRVAISTGAGKSMVKYALQKQAQVLISGDIDHHTAIDALDCGLQIIDAGHFGTEHFMVSHVSDYLQKIYGSEIEIFQAQENTPFFTI